MTEVWILAVLIVVIIVGVVGVILAVTRDVPDEEQMSDRWREENERDRGKK